MVVDFELKNFALGNLTKSVFQSGLGLFLLNRGLVEECIPTNRFRKRRIFFIWLDYEKLQSTSGGCQISSSKKCRDNLTKSVFQSSLWLILLNCWLAKECVPANRFCRTEYFDLVLLGKKYSGDCQISSSKNSP